LMMGFHTMLLGFVTDLLAVNRKLLEELQQAERRRQLATLQAERTSSRPPAAALIRQKVASPD
jgi:hypothetical protein